MKYKSNSDHTRGLRQRTPKRSLAFSPIRSPSGTLLLWGHFLILLALCEFAARLATGSAEHLLYLETFMGSVSSAAVLLWGAGLGLDYLDCVRRKSSQ